MAIRRWIKARPDLTITLLLKLGEGLNVVPLAILVSEGLLLSKTPCFGVLKEAHLHHESTQGQLEANEYGLMPGWSEKCNKPSLSNI